MRQTREDVEILGTATETIMLGKKQFFCELPKSWELWGYIGDLPYRIQKWSKESIMFMRTKGKN